MATTGSGVGSPPEGGIHITGELVGAGPGRAYGEGEARRHPYNVTLLVGRQTWNIEYPDRQSGEAAVREAAQDVPGSPEEGRAIVTLRVFPRIGGKRVNAEQCFIVLAGPRAREDNGGD